jgi:choline dehydrogenase-like flavoprotein
MIEDIREVLEDGAEASFDIVVVGAGPAGFSVALALKDSGLKVAVLEAGGSTHPGSDGLALYDGDVTGLPYPLAASRQRFFGGTSNHWGGWCRPLDRSDFLPRDWIPLSGWPFGLDELAPWYAKAGQVLEIEGSDYDGAEIAGSEQVLPADTDSGFDNRLFRFSPPTRFAQRYADELRNAPDVTVFLHAAVTGFQHANGRIESVEVRTLEGQAYTVNGNKFVLAAGGLEVPRLLLHTVTDSSPALGNQSDLLGRCFMEHYGYFPGYLLTRSDLRYYRYAGAEGDIMPVLVPRESLMERERLRNVCISLTAVEPDVVWPPEALATPGLARKIEGDAWRYQITLINEPGPNPDSQVILGEERDALGLRRLKLHWAITEADLESIDRLMGLLGRWVGRKGLGRLQFTRPISPETTERFSGGLHHMGTTRMSDFPDRGVVDPDCRVFGTENLYVASSSVFPAVGYANPTLTIVALALRLADHLKRGRS